MTLPLLKIKIQKINRRKSRKYAYLKYKINIKIQNPHSLFKMKLVTVLSDLQTKNKEKF